ARGRGELRTARSTRVAGVLALLVGRLYERPVRAGWGTERATLRVDHGVGATDVPIAVGIRGPAGAPGATPGQVESQRGEGHAPDGVPGGRVARGGGGAGPRQRSHSACLVLTPLIPSPFGPHPCPPLGPHPLIPSPFGSGETQSVRRSPSPPLASSWPDPQSFAYAGRRA